MDDPLFIAISESPDLKENTKERYSEILINLTSKLYPIIPLMDILDEADSFVDHYTKVHGLPDIPDIPDKTDYQRMTNYVKCILALFKYNPELMDMKPIQYQKWKILRRKYSDEIYVFKLHHNMTEREKLAFIPYEELQKCRNNVTNPINYGRVLLAMYLDIPPVRNDYWKLRVYQKKEDVPKDQEDNYIILDEKKIVLLKFKTSETYGIIEIDMPDTLFHDVRYTMLALPRKFLFETFRKKPFANPSSFCNWANTCLKNLLNNNYFTLTTFRHVFLSRKDLNFRHDKKLRDEVARIMGHSVIQQLEYMWDLNEN